MKVDVVVTLANQFAGDGDKVAEMLSMDGLIVDRVYPFGVIKGRAEAEDLNKLRNHQEVEDLRYEQMIGLSPPDADIQ